MCICARVCVLEATGEDKDNDLIPLLFCRDTFFPQQSIHQSLYPSLHPSLLSSNFAPSLLKSQRSHLHPNRQEHTHRKGTAYHKRTDMEADVMVLFFIKQHFRTTSSES